MTTKRTFKEQRRLERTAKLVKRFIRAEGRKVAPGRAVRIYADGAPFTRLAVAHTPATEIEILRRKYQALNPPRTTT